MASINRQVREHTNVLVEATPISGPALSRIVASAPRERPEILNC